MTRKECLDAAAGCVLKNRNSEYGEPEDSFGVIANFWSVYLGRKVYPHDVAMMMSLLKIARIKANRGYADGYIDLAGYAACGAECAAEAPSPAPKDGDELVVLWKHKPEPEPEPKFKPGDKVQACYNEERGVWFDGVVEKVKEGRCHIRRPNGEEISAPMKLIRKQPAETETEPQFKAGDKVQIRVTLPSVSDCLWVDGTYARYDRGSAFPHAVYNDAGLEENVKEEDIRPAPKAEGCEDLVQDEISEVERIFGTLTKPPLVERDAPQTTQELYSKILESNPAIYGRPCTPTGEELAEMAEEDAHE